MSIKVKIYLIVVTLLNMFFILNCSPSHMVGAGGSQSSVAQDTSGIIGGALEGASLAIYEQTLFPVLRTNCAACHGTSQAPLHSVSDVNSSHTTVLSYSLANLTTPASSRLYIKINSGHQGFPQSVAMDILAAITAWSDQLSAAGGVVPDVPVIVLEPTYASIRQLILEPKCVSCHGAALARGGVRYDSYANTMRTVNAGLPRDSSFYNEVESGSMPRSAASLSTNELNVISLWITNGALNN